MDSEVSRGEARERLPPTLHAVPGRSGSGGAGGEKLPRWVWPQEPEAQTCSWELAAGSSAECGENSVQIPPPQPSPGTSSFPDPHCRTAPSLTVRKSKK